MINNFIKNKICLIILIVSITTILTSCVNITNPLPDIEVVKAANQYNTALYANDQGNNGFYVKREVAGVVGCYLVCWNETNNKIDTSMFGSGHLMFSTEDEHLKKYEIVDFELLSVYINLYYYVYFSANDKIYEYVLEDSSVFISNRFTYVNFREVNPLMDGFNRIITTSNDTVIIDKEENILEDVENESIVNVFGMNYLYLDENKNLIYENISKTKPIKYIFIEEETEVVYSILNNNYAIVLTSNQKIYKLQYNDLSVKTIDVVNPEFIVTTLYNNYFAVVEDGVIKVYNYMLDLVGEITPVEPTGNIVGLSLSFVGSVKYKKLVLTTAYLNGNVLYSDVKEIKLS